MFGSVGTLSAQYVVAYEDEATARHTGAFSQSLFSRLVFF